MTSLHENCRLLPNERVLWVNADGQVDIDGLQVEYATNEAALKAYTGKKIAVQFGSDLLLARLLVMLDGLVAQILLLPQGVSHEERNSFLDSTGTEIFVADRPVDANHPVDEGVMCIYWDGTSIPKLNESGASRCHETNWVLATSGTTGTPKLVSHTLASLTRSVVGNIHKGANYRWALLYELSRFAGLQVFLQAFLSGSMLIFPARDAPLIQKLEFLSGKGVNSISATPSMWRQILMSTMVDDLKLQQITLGGEIADQKILSSLTARFPQARIVHIYASTEAGVGFVVKDGLVGFPASWLITPPDGIDMKINQDGMLFLRTTLSEQKYVDNGNKSVCDDNGFVLTGDLVKKKADRYIFLGRDSGAINVGGNKVVPEEVEAVVLAMDEVSQCHVYGKSNPFLGQLVVADVLPVVDINHETLSNNIVSYCRDRLAAYKVPALVNVVQDFDFTSTGKIKR